jgi:hypothetical protein
VEASKLVKNVRHNERLTNGTPALVHGMGEVEPRFGQM